jgi:hypothetical protein
VVRLNFNRRLFDQNYSGFGLSYPDDNTGNFAAGLFGGWGGDLFI